MFVFERPQRARPRRRRSDGRRADGACHVLCPRVSRGGAVRLLIRVKSIIFQAADIMALVSRKRTVSGGRSSGTANAFAAIENQLMAKVLLIEDDSETAEEITAELSDRGFEVEWSATTISQSRSPSSSTSPG